MIHHFKDFSPISLEELNEKVAMLKRAEQKYVVKEEQLNGLLEKLIVEFGKSFFMHALQSQIAVLAIRSQQAIEAHEPSIFCSRIVQIEFNAWHFVESNLWASLARSPNYS